MKRFFFFGIFLLFCILILSFSGHAASVPSVKETILKIEKRRGPWISLKANLEIHFLTADEQHASCKGKIAYQRLDEKILLQCFNEKKELLFIFKTLDKDFELYLPLQKALFRGNIFSLQDSPDIQSHLQALDLYRALKPAAIPLEAQIKTHRANGNGRIEVYSLKKDGSFLSRELAVTEAGDVVEETYYRPDLVHPAVRIERLEFEAGKYSDSGKEIFFFPRKIRIESNQESFGRKGIAETVLVFQRLEFLLRISEKEFKYLIPAGTKIIAVENPRLKFDR